MSTITIFLASSGELESERRKFENFIYQRCKSLHKDNVFIDVIAWENSLNNALSQTRLQDEYNKAIRGSDIFVALFATKAGQFTVEEFGIAYKQFKQTNKPQVFTYFQEPADRQPSLVDFFAKLKALGHFPTRYKNTEDLHLQFWQQLEFYLTEHEIKSDALTQQADEIYNFPNIPKPDFFIGRDDLLAEIHQRLLQDEPVLLMNGLGGIGKTAAAQTYVNKYRDSYKHIASVFVGSDLRQNMVDKLRQPLGIEFAPNSSLAEQFEAVILSLQQVKSSTKPNLLLLDNADNQQELIDLKSVLKSTGWQILVTSRCQPDDYDIVAVDELSPVDAEDLFLHYYRPTEQDLLPALLDKIYYHTLMIELIAKAGKKKRLTIKQLLERLDSGLSHQDLQRVITVGSHADSQLKEKQAKLYEYILAMFEPAELDATMQTILRYFSVLPAEDIPLAHLKTLFAIEDDNQFEDDLDSLFQYGWLSAKDDSYKMHALVQDVVFAKLAVDNANIAELIATLSEIMQQNLNIAYDYLSYAKSVTQKVTTSGYEIGWLNIYLSDNYNDIGQLENALASIKIASKHFKNCDEQYSLTVSYERAGNIHQALGQVDKALEFFELYNNLSEELYDSNPKSESLKNGLAISYHRLGTINEAQGKLDDALKHYGKYKDLMLELFNDNQKSEKIKNDLAISYAKLGDIHQALGQVDKALEFFELYNNLSKELYESNPKSEDLKIGLAISYHRLGAINEAQGKLDDALKHYEKYKDLMLELSNDNQKSEKIKNDLAISYEKLGNIHQALGQVDKALEFFELYNELSKELYDSNPKSESLKNGLAISYEKLGDIHQTLGKVDKALEFFKLCNKLSEELYESNPKSENLKKELAISYERLGGIHQALGKVDKALEFFELRMQLGKKFYESNPKSESLKNGLAISYLKLGEIHQDLGQVDKALEFFEIFNQIMKELYESSAKNVEITNNLAISYYKLGGIYQVKKIPFYKFFAIRQNRQQVLAMYKNAITLWQELYQTTQLDSYKQSLEKLETAHLQVKAASYAPIILATLVSLFGGLYWLDWVSGWWLVGLVIWFWPLRLPVKKVLSIKIPLLVLLVLVAWFV
ncbi:tetratricopeptide repeat protein [Candidatus Parabeggiatoa sp. HSG14]|uniref:tetratricopeptide repeat protein n=1 Tax=Candidatus Parabeggiatoa sp. HSG14 TaxID=3055593 RepID=UPI0025A78440|nr:NB-ARC domain-containing protein [Thiotrichales bacterium HSG14]